LARKPGTTKTATKSGTSRQKATLTSNTGGARRRSAKAVDETEGSDERDATTIKATRKRQPQTSKNPAAANSKVTDEKRSSSRTDQRASRTSKLKSVLGSTIVRNVVAAGLASAAAAILYRKPKDPAARDEDANEAPTELMPGEGYGIVAKARMVRQSSTLVDEPTSTAALRSPRKRRSDAGVKRTSLKTRAEVGAPSGIEPVAGDVPASLSTTETSVRPSDTDLGTAIDTNTNAADEQLVEAHPS
jgi:hypothetical protein